MDLQIYKEIHNICQPKYVYYEIRATMKTEANNAFFEIMKNVQKCISNLLSTNPQNGQTRLIILWGFRLKG